MATEVESINGEVLESDNESMSFDTDDSNKLEHETGPTNIELVNHNYNNDTKDNLKSDSSYKITENEVDDMMGTIDQINKTQNTTTIVTDKVDHSDSDLSDYSPNQQPNSNNAKSSQALDIDIQLKLQNKIETKIMYSGHFWLRICILFLTIMLILLCICYACGAVSSTELLVIERCPGYQLEDIWLNSLEINSATGDQDGCWVTSNFKFNEETAYSNNTYIYNPKHDDFAIFQCVLFSLFAVYCGAIIIYGIYSLIKDLIAIKNQKLYQYAPKFKDYLRNQQNNNQNNQNGMIQQQKPQHPINACIERWKLKYDKIFGTDTNGYIVRTLIMETWEIVLQTFALWLYNGYDVWNPDTITLAYKTSLIYIFVTVLSFSCLITGILWLLYVLKPDKCSGLLFNLLLFCVDQFSDFFYAIFPFILVFGNPNVHLQSEDFDGNQHSVIWVFFGFLNIDEVPAFIYAVVPLFLLCNKSLIMTRKAIRGMRNSSFDEWLFVTKLMEEPDDKTALYLANLYGLHIDDRHSKSVSTNPKSTNTEVVNGESDASSNTTKIQKSQKTNIIGDEIYDKDGHLNLNMFQSKYSVNDGKPKSKRCKIMIGSIGVIFILYSIIILSIVIDHLSTSIEYCSSAKDDMNILMDHPELSVYSGCGYQVHPFTTGDISNSCNCREFDFSWSDEYAQDDVTKQAIINGILIHWDMLEKFRFDDVNEPNLVHFEFRDLHFNAKYMKLFSLSDFDIKNGSLPETISNYKVLRYFSLERCGSVGKIPQSMQQLKKLKVLRLQTDKNYYISGYLARLCGMENMRIINIRGGTDEFIPKCITDLKLLESLSITQTSLRSFPLTMLYMPRLLRINLWQNDISYHHISKYNNFDNTSMINQTTFWENYQIIPKFRNTPNGTQGSALILNNNPVCFKNVTFYPFWYWAVRQSACDNQQCSLPDTSGTPTSCSLIGLANGVCDPKCSKQSCHFDNGDCYQHCFTLTDCSYSMFMNQECDQECNNEYCNWDAEYCLDSDSNNNTMKITTPSPSRIRPSPSCFELSNCTHSLFQNLVCDQECNNEYCVWDRNKCLIDENNITMSMRTSEYFTTKIPTRYPSFPGGKVPGGKGGSNPP